MHLELFLADMINSRMGIYLQTGHSQGHVCLQELFSDSEKKTYCPTEYAGSAGDLWFVRLVPDRASEEGRFIVFTTPYILTAGLESWLAYFDRQCQNTSSAYENVMKCGLHPKFWLEYIFQAYSDHMKDGSAIYLAGVPDIAATRPHFSDFSPNILPESS